MFNKQNLFKNLFAVICLIFFSGCSTTPYVKPLPQRDVFSLPGIYHKVEKGETLWRISRRYGVDLEQLIRANRISDSTSIEIGQQIFIPDQLRDKSLEYKYAESDDFIWPARGRIICAFGHNFNNMANKGINIFPYDSKDIVASRSGKVVFLSEKFAGLGKTVILDHGDGFFTVYAANSETFVKPGESIKKGTVIARVTGTGKNGYLHFEIRKGHLAQNPTFYLP